MATITTRAAKGLALTHSEVDNNFTGLNSAKLEFGQAQSVGVAFGVPYLNGSKVLTSGSALVFDGSNLGLGVTPSAWGAYRAIQVGVGASIASAATTSVVMSSNSYNSNGSGWKYVATSAAAQYEQFNGGHYWSTAPSGTAGASITFTQAMTLNASGNLLVGQTSGAARVSITQGGASQDCVGISIGSGGAGVTVSSTATASTSLYITTSSGYAGAITSLGTTTTYATSSDYRLKRNQKPLAGSGKFIDALKPTSWEWSRDGRKDAGFIAHEFQEVCPNAVNGTKDEMEVQAYEVSPAIAAVTEQREATPAVYDGEVIVTPATFKTVEVTPAIPAVLGERTVPKYQSMQASNSEVMANIIAELQSLRSRVAGLEAV